MEIGRLLTSTCGLHHVVAFAWKAQRHAPPGRLRFGALCPERTGMAGRLRSPHASHEQTGERRPRLYDHLLVEVWHLTIEDVNRANASLNILALGQQPLEQD